MRVTKAYLLSAAASVLLGTVAHADDPAHFARGGNAGGAVLHDANAREGIVRYPEAHWTSSIGTGTAAAFEQAESASKPVQNDDPQTRPVHSPEAYWASRIGTGTATAFER